MQTTDKSVSDASLIQMEHDIFEFYMNEFVMFFYHDVVNDDMKLRYADNAYQNNILKIIENENNYLDAFIKIVNEYVHPDDIKKVVDAITPENYLEYLCVRKSKTIYFRWKHENRYYIYVKLIISKLNGGCEKPNKVLIACQDVDEDVRRKIAQQEIRKRYEHGFYALSREYINIYYVNLDTAELVPYNMSNRIEGMFGDSFYRLNYDEAMSAYIKSAVKEEDKEMMNEILSRKSILTKFKFGDTFTKVYLNNDNEYCEMKCVKVSDKDNKGGNVCIMGFSANDDKIRAEQNMKKQRNFQMSLLNGLTREYHTVWLINPNHTMELYRTTDDSLIDRVVAGNMAEARYEVAINDYIEKNVVYSDRRRVKRAVNYNKLLQSVPDVGGYNVTYQISSADGNNRYHQACFSKANGSNGEINLVMAFRDVDEIIRDEIRQKEKYEHVIKERDMDGLTGIRNRYCYEHKIRRYARKKCRNVSCIYIDVDNLHETNNTKGHEAGDELIKFVAKGIVNCWGNDHTFRIGGDEFVVFVFNSDNNRIADDVQKFERKIKDANYSVSVGYNSSELIDESFNDLIKKAEKMMYDNKKSHHSRR